MANRVSKLEVMVIFVLTTDKTDCFINPLLRMRMQGINLFFSGNIAIASVYPQHMYTGYQLATT